MSDDSENKKPELVTKVFIKKVSKNETNLLNENFGISTKSGTSLEKTVLHIDVVRERIRKIEERALRKIRKKPDPNNDGPDVA